MQGIFPLFRQNEKTTLARKMNLFNMQGKTPKTHKTLVCLYYLLYLNRSKHKHNEFKTIKKTVRR